MIIRISRKNSKVKSYIKDVHNYASIEMAMHCVDCVFHAAGIETGSHM